MACLEDLKLSTIKKLKEVYYVKHKISLNKSIQNKASIVHFNKKDFLYNIKHCFLLSDSFRLFTTVDEAIDYCINNNYEYEIVEYRKQLIEIIN